MIVNRDPGDENDYWVELPPSPWMPPGMRFVAARYMVKRLLNGIVFRDGLHWWNLDATP